MLQCYRLHPPRLADLYSGLTFLVVILSKVSVHRHLPVQAPIPIPFYSPQLLLNLRPCLSVMPLSGNSAAHVTHHGLISPIQSFFCLIHSLSKRLPFFFNCPLPIKCACLCRPVDTCSPRFPATYSIRYLMKCV